MHTGNTTKSSSAKWLKLRQLDKNLSRYKSLQKPTTEYGWIREIRRTLGMTTKQLATRIGVSQPTVVELEANEAKGTITLKSLSKAADAMNCTVVYAIVPKSSLEETLREQISNRAKERVKHVSHTMRLEAQESGRERESDELNEIFHRMLINPPRNVWED